MTLDRFARFERQPEKICDHPINAADDRVAPVKVAGFAGAKIGDPDVVRDLRWAAPFVDSLDQCRACPWIQEAPDNVQLERVRRDALHTRRRCEARSGTSAGGT